MRKLNLGNLAHEIKVTLEAHPNAPDRVSAIMYGALVENQLTACLTLSLRDDEKIENELFRPGAPIGAFKPKLQLAYMMHIVDSQHYGDIDRIVKVRNEMAHNVDTSSFEQQPVCNWVQSLSTNASYQELYDLGVSKGYPEEHPFVLNGIVIRKTGHRPQFEWAAQCYFNLLQSICGNTWAQARGVNHTFDPGWPWSDKSGPPLPPDFQSSS
ncbi:MAG: hypothetical protein GC201_01745 [Alphaproteobacteria bacterium]|nr:hypothetical protein [Alphaproteobacteria bacterium]